MALFRLIVTSLSMVEWEFGVCGIHTGGASASGEQWAKKEDAGSKDWKWKGYGWQGCGHDKSTSGISLLVTNSTPTLKLGNEHRSGLKILVVNTVLT